MNVTSPTMESRARRLCTRSFSSFSHAYVIRDAALKIEIYIYIYVYVHTLSSQMTEDSLIIIVQCIYKYIIP